MFDNQIVVLIFIDIPKCTRHRKFYAFYSTFRLYKLLHRFICPALMSIRWTKQTRKSSENSREMFSKQATVINHSKNTKNIQS